MSFMRATSWALQRWVPAMLAVGMRIRRWRIQTCGAWNA
jgi:hypothetical protein